MKSRAALVVLPIDNTRRRLLNDSETDSFVSNTACRKGGEARRERRQNRGTLKIAFGNSGTHYGIQPKECG